MSKWNSFKNYFRREKQSAVAGMHVSGGSGVVYSDRDYENFAKENYMKNIVGFRCIDMISKAAAGVPWKVFKKTLVEGEEKTEQIAHPLNSLIRRPNPWQSWQSLIRAMTSYYLIAGNTYLEKISPEGGPNKGIPKELYTHQPNRMKVMVNGDGLLSGYEYEVNGKRKSWEMDIITGACDILHIKDFHPLNDFYGLSITEPAAREIDTSNSAGDWNKNLLDNEARPGMIFSFEKNLTDAQYNKLKDSLKNEYGGAKNAGKSLLIDGIGEGKTGVQQYGFSPKDMEFIDGNRELARRICWGYGVPPQLLGIPGDNTYSNYKEARQAFYEDTIFWYLNFYKGEFNIWFFGAEEDGVGMDYILDDIPALAPKRDAVWERAEKATFISTNEKREMVKKDITEGGDVILIPANSIPLSELDTMLEDDRQRVEDEDEELGKPGNEDEDEKPDK